MLVVREAAGQRGRPLTGNPLAHVRTGPHGPLRQKGLVRGDKAGCGREGGVCMWGAGPGCGIWRRIGQGPREALLNSDLQSPERRLSQSVEALEAKRAVSRSQASGSGCGTSCLALATSSPQQRADGRKQGVEGLSIAPALPPGPPRRGKWPCSVLGGDQRHQRDAAQGAGQVPSTAATPRP